MLYAICIGAKRRQVTGKETCASVKDVKEFLDVFIFKPDLQKELANLNTKARMRLFYTFYLY